MVRSMTGFGRGEAVGETDKVTVELRSINNRYLEVVTRLPKALIALEDPIKKQLNQWVFRGRVDVFVTLEEIAQKPKTLKTDEALAVAYYQSMQKIAGLCEISSEIKLDHLVQLPGLFTMEKPEDDLETIGALVQQALAEAATHLVDMRQLEGDRLAADLLQRKDTVQEQVRQIAERAPLVVKEYQEKLKNRIQELLEDTAAFDEARFANEVAYFADRASITEELIRLDSHLAQLQALLSSNDVVGRKLDFLMQELNREINTIGSKANDLEINRLVIDVKSELEKIREQVQNIE